MNDHIVMKACSGLSNKPAFQVARGFCHGFPYAGLSQSGSMLGGFTRCECDLVLA
jgi:hypothetical protein